MVIKVENLGTLKTAETDLSKNLIVYSGKNNSGKTYMLNLVYGLKQFALGLSFKNLYELVKPFKSLDAEIKKLIETTKTEVDMLFLSEKKIKEQFINFYLETRFKKVLPSISKNPTIDYEIGSMFENENAQKFSPALSKRHYDCRYKYPYFYYEATGKFEGNPNETKTSTYDRYTGFFISEFEILSKVILGFTKKPTFFTAERVASLMFGRDIYKYKAKQNLENEYIDKVKNGIPDYPLAILDELEFINNFEYNRTNSSNYSYLADELETLMGGKISANQDGLLLFKEGRTSHLVTNSSSTVKSLATLVFYLRHTAQKGDCIIIDEPELSLHPDNQRKIARFLARCVNEGFKVIISTHSDYIINEINNLITLYKHKTHKNTKKIMQAYGYKDNQTLDYQEVGAYFFQENQCKKLEVSETGFSIETINKEINELSNVSDEIFQNFSLLN